MCLALSNPQLSQGGTYTPSQHLPCCYQRPDCLLYGCVHTHAPQLGAHATPSVPELPACMQKYVQCGPAFFGPALGRLREQHTSHQSRLLLSAAPRAPMQDLLRPVMLHDVFPVAVRVEIHPLGETAAQPTALHVAVFWLTLVVSDACGLGLRPRALTIALNAHCTGRRADTQAGSTTSNVSEQVSCFPWASRRIAISA